ncbi:MAG: MFS transporter, partial [Syntrophomonas sp.]
MLTLPEHLVNSASAAMNLVRQVSGSLGVAYTTYMVTQRQAYHAAMLTDSINYNAPLALSTLSQMQSYLNSQGITPNVSWNGTLEIVRSLVQKQSYMSGIDDTLVMLTMVGICSIPLVFMLSKQRVELQKQKDGIV